MRGLVLVALLACAAAAQQQVRVGAKNFTESAVLAELMAQVIEAETGFAVERVGNLGGTMLCWAALTSGEVDLYAEYTGTGWATVLGDTRRVTDPLRTFLEVRRRCRERFDVRWLDPFGFENTYALAMREDLAEELSVRRISDLRAHQDRVRVGFGIEFGRRADGYLGLAPAYGLDFADLRMVEHGLAYEGIEAGAIDLMDAYSTDGKLLRYRLRVLEDDRGFFPPYHAAPVVRGALLDAHPEIGRALAKLAFVLTERDAQAMNYLVETGGYQAPAVVRAMLEELGIVDGIEPTAATARAALRPLREPALERPELEVPPRPGVFGLLQTRWGPLLEQLQQHLLLTLVTVVLATLTAVPVGVALRRRPRLRRAALEFAGVLQTVPSLALLAFMIPLLGLGERSALAALYLYALLPILRNTCTGLLGVPPALVDAARGMGMRPREVLRHVELPLAVPTIMAGIRTATVISIGVATLAGFVGAGGLGEPILEGLYLNYGSMILLGAVPAALLAIASDRLLGALERRLRPAGHAAA